MTRWSSTNVERNMTGKIESDTKAIFEPVGTAADTGYPLALQPGKKFGMPCSPRHGYILTIQVTPGGHNVI